MIEGAIQPASTASSNILSLSPSLIVKVLFAILFTNGLAIRFQPAFRSTSPPEPTGSPIIGLKDAQHHLMLDQPHTFTENLDNLIQHLLDRN